jgi:hypothetical protein
MRTLLLALGAAGALAGCERAPTAPAPAETSTTEPTGAPKQRCAQFPRNPDQDPDARWDVPKAFDRYVEASATTLTVQRNEGAPACIDISYGQPNAWDSFADGRLFGVGIIGDEYNSYLIVDRRGTEDPIETGFAPTFSPSDRRFASVDISESGFGAFEALGVWEMGDRSIRNLVTLQDLLDRGYDWKLERWASDDCLVFSSTDEATPEDTEDRKTYELRLTGAPSLKDSSAEAACR